MKIIKKNVYYCDYCKKKSLSASALIKHEKHCTANPNRLCRLCEIKNISEIILGFKQRFEITPHIIDITNPSESYHECDVVWKGESITLKEIRESVDNCPNCIFAILRQAGLNRHYFEIEPFEYQKELTAFLSERESHNCYDY